MLILSNDIQKFLWSLHICLLSAMSKWRTEGKGLGSSNPLSEIPMALQNHAKLNPIVKTVKNCWI